ncbi:MAG: hypothetical protein QM582_13950 [Micropruina sp.]|uniref:hypothetical protein n=1 Tax=Micropruina sp. TaxID=2737536 RepID=UPI0039E51990
MSPTLKRLLAVGTAATLALSASATLAPTATAATEVDTTKAANYLVKNLPASGDGASASMTAALGLATTGDCSYAPALQTLVKQIEKNTKSYLYPSKKLNQARAANLAIVVSSLGLNPKKFAGYNLVSLVTKSLPKDGQLGASKSAFSQSLGIIALKRANATIPVTLLTNLLGQQGDNGAFGYEYPAGTFNADPDTTAMGILALKSLGQLKPQQDAATGWAKSAQKSAGYWENYSPVDSTGLLGSALGSGAEVTKAKAWLGTVQHSDGGFPNSLDAGTESNPMATANALWLINGTSLLDVSLDLGKCPKTPSLPKATASCSGVWVVVDRGNGQQTVRCATKYSTGLAALKSAGFTVDAKDGFVNRIHGFPSKLDTTFSKYWGYWSATPKSDGTWNAWTSYAVGAATSKPVKGSVEGWVYGPYPGDNAQPDLAAPPAGYTASPVPAISGTAKVGKTLTVATGTWSPKPEKLSIRWYRSGKAISKATKTGYKLTKSDAGKTITVKVTASGTGLQTVSKTSKATAKVAK